MKTASPRLLLTTAYLPQRTAIVINAVPTSHDGSHLEEIDWTDCGQHVALAFAHIANVSLCS
jgi:hypothetical protein